MRPRKLLAIAVAALIAACAFTSATQAADASVSAPEFKGGEHWTYREVNPYNRTQQRTITLTLEARPQGFELRGRSDRETDPVLSETVTSPWLVASESDGTRRRTFDPPLESIRFPLTVGEKWKQTVQMTDERGQTRNWRASFRTVRWEKVKTPAGEFNALRVERQMNLGDREASWGDTSVFDVFWYVPEVQRWVRRERRSERHERAVEGRVERDWTVWELVQR